MSPFRTSGSALLTKQLIQQSFCSLHSFVRKHHGFRFANGIGDVTLLVQAIHCIPVKAPPGPPTVVQPKVEEREDSVVDFVLVEFHGVISGAWV